MVQSQVETLQMKITGIIQGSEKRKMTQRTFQTLSRGEDPRSVRDTSKFDDRKGVQPDTKNPLPLRINDPQTFMGFATHILAGNEIRWQMPVKVDIEDIASEQNGMAERFLQSIYRMNNERMWNQARMRLDKANADTALRMGYVAIYHEAIEDEDGISFILEPWDPLTVSEKTDKHGLSAVVREINVELDGLIVEAEATDGWDAEVLRQIQRSSKGQETVDVQEYYEREYVLGGPDIIRHAVLIKNHKTAVMTLNVMEDTEKIPVFIHKFNGEAFPGERIEKELNSILSNNLEVYLQDHDLMGQLDAHARKSLSDKMQELTARGRAVANPQNMFKPDHHSITTYDAARGDRGLELVPVNPLDPALLVRGDRLIAMKQKGAVPDVVQGLVDSNLSGFAIQQILEVEVSTVQEVQLVLEYMNSRIGKWILDTFKKSKVRSTRVVGFKPNADKNSEYTFEEFTPADVPEYTDIRAQIDLAQPSDLLERINMMRQAKGGAGPIFTDKTGYERIFPDIIPDPLAEMEALREQTFLDTEISKVVQHAAEAKRIAAEIRAGLRPSEPGEMADWWDTISAQMLQSVGIASGGDNREAQTNTNPPQTVLPVESRTAGAGGVAAGGGMGMGMGGGNGVGPIGPPGAGAGF
jgi:hypothetical protein